MNVKILRLGSAAITEDVPAGATVDDALHQANVSATGYSISINGLSAAGNTALNDDDVITLVPKVEGGC